MTSRVKLPPFPPIPWNVLGGIANDCVSAEAIHNYATAYAEQAVREALEAQVRANVTNEKGALEACRQVVERFGPREQEFLWRERLTIRKCRAVLEDGDF